MLNRLLILVGLLTVTGGAALAAPGDATAAEEAAIRKQAAAALRKAVRFFHEKVSTHGGYVGVYSADLAKREGENQATETQIWIQPPGTPTAGMALVTAYEATKDVGIREAMRDAAHALVRTQLRSGGWGPNADFDPALRKKIAYRVDPEGPQQTNRTSLDDNTTQSAVRFLMHADRALQFQDNKIHEAVKYALDSLGRAQYPNGAWPQSYIAFPELSRYPVKRASFPEKWMRVQPRGRAARLAGVKEEDFRLYYTLNDDLQGRMIDVFLDAAEIYGRAEYRSVAEKAGDFLIMAQLPEPQPGWAQQYDFDMHPGWARKFEPPSVTGGETQGIIKTLMSLYERTGKRKYLEPVPSALAWLKRSRLPNGKLARFYEMKTNRALYFDKTYELSYTKDDLPEAYGWEVGIDLPRVEQEFARVQAIPQAALGKAPRPPRAKKPAAAGIMRASKVVAAMDERGAWVEDGKLVNQKFGDNSNRVIRTQTFADNVVFLSRYLATIPLSTPD